ncbi:MAG: hypothetical protein U0X20_08835 [Caldilineaceae bacterium]
MHHHSTATPASHLSLARFLLVVATFVATLCLAPRPASAAPLPGGLDTGFPGLDPAWQAALVDVVAADAAYLPGPAPYAVTAFDTYHNATGDWALAVIVPSAVVETGWEDLNLAQLVDVLLVRAPDGSVTGHVRSHPAFLDLARRVPRPLVDYSQLLTAATLGPAARQEAVDYRFPWTAGQTWWLAGSWHSGYGSDALDFGPYTAEDPPINSAVLAAAGGTLRMACQNDQEQRLLWIDHPNGERTGYLHIDRQSAAEAVENQNLVGQVVAQGTYLGQIYRGEVKLNGQCPANFPDCRFNTLCGYGSAPHLHFISPNRTITIDGFNIGAMADGSAGSNFTSTNERRGILPDAQPPTAWLTAPVSGTAISPAEDRLYVTIAATDTIPATPASVTSVAGAAPAAAPSGVAAVSAQLAWEAADGIWYSSAWIDAAPAGQDTFTLSLNTCSPDLRVPHNRPVRISLRAADKAGNAAEFPGAGLYRFDHPDVDTDCAVGLRDLLDINAALAGRRPPQLDYDIDDDGIFTPADAVLLASRLPRRGGASGERLLTSVGVFGGEGADLGWGLPGSLAITFTPLAAVGGLDFAQAVVVTGTTAYIADWPTAELAAASTLTATIGGRLALGSRIYGVTAHGDQVYVADPGDEGSRLWVLAAAPAITPTLVASVTVPGEAMQPVAQSGTISDLLYLAAGTAGLHMIDVTEPETPTLLATLDTGGSAAAAGALGDFVYVVDRMTGLIVVDISDPAQPQVTGTLPISGTALGVTAAATSTRTLAYVAAGLGGVAVVDVTDPPAPQLLGTFATASAANNVLLDGTVLFVAAGWQGVLALDVSHPDVPHLLGSYDTPGYAYGLQLAGDLLLVADGEAELQRLQVARVQGPPYGVLLPLAGKDIAP